MIGKQKYNYKNRNDFVVAGLGKFGFTVAKALIKKGCHVTAIDTDEKKIEEAAEFAMDVLIADAKDEKALIEAGVANADLAIVSMGEELESSFITTLHLKEMGIPWIVSKATSKSQGEILEKIGADRVIFPEEEMAEKLADQLLSPSIINYLPLGENVGFIEALSPSIFTGKSLKQLSLRNKYGINLIAIRRTEKNKKEDEEEVIVVPSAKEIIKKGDILDVVGNKDYLEKFMNLEREPDEIKKSMESEHN